MCLPSPNHGRSDRGGEREEMRQGLRGHSHWCTWERCPQQDKPLRELPWQPGTHATLRALTDPERRPAFPREPLSCRSGTHAACRAIPVGHRPLLEFEKIQERSWPRTIRDALGPLVPVAGGPRDSELLAQVASQMGVGTIARRRREGNHRVD